MPGTRLTARFTSDRNRGGRWQLEENRATSDRKTKEQRKTGARGRRLDPCDGLKSAFKMVCYNPAWGMKYGMGDEF